MPRDDLPRLPRIFSYTFPSFPCYDISHFYPVESRRKINEKRPPFQPQTFGATTNDNPIAGNELPIHFILAACDDQLHGAIHPADRYWTKWGVSAGGLTNGAASR